MKRLLICLLSLLLSLCMATGLSAAEKSISLLFINIGKGDACLIRTEGSAWLVDTGKKAMNEQLMRVLEAAEVSRLDGVIITHTDKDHAGGLKKLLKSEITVDELYCGTAYTLDAGEEHPVMDASEKYDIPLHSLSAGDQIVLSEGIVLNILGPLYTDLEEENNNSLVMMLVSPYGKALLTGDMEQEEEESLIANGLIGACDVLKVAHHGKYSGGSKNFYLLTKPKIAVISTDTDEEPDSADSKVISYLWDVGAEVCITQNTELGYCVSMDENGIRIEEFQPAS